MSTEFNVGDLVALKSGGEVMTVTDVLDDSVVVEWFDDYENLHDARFPNGTLVHVCLQQHGVHGDHWVDKKHIAFKDIKLATV